MFVKTNYAGHSYPKLIEFMKELPKTNSGKIIRMKLKELEEKRAGK
jgi:acetyl-CoA synthetase